MLHESPQGALMLVLAILATWRMSTLLCYESGPFDFLSQVRRILYRLHLGALVECFHCMSVWVALALVLISYQPGWHTPLLCLAIAGGTSIIERIIQK